MQLSVSHKVDQFAQIKPTKQESFKFPLSFKVSLALSILVLSFLITIIFILMLYLEPKLIVVNNHQITHPDGSQHGMAELQLTQRSILKPNLNMTLFVTYLVEDSKGRKLQSADANYLVHSFEPEIGVTVRMSPLGNTSFFINQRQFESFAKKQIQKNSWANTNNLMVNSQQEYLEQLSSIFEGAIKESTGTPNIKIKFDNITMAKLKINPTKQMQMEFDTSSDRLLMEHERSLSFFSGVLKIAKSVLPKVAGFLVNTIKKHGPLIGKIAGGIIGGVGGFFIGGPMGAFQGAMTGMSIGETIGSAASSLVNSCIPQGTLRISCTPQSIGSVMSRFGGGSSFAGIANQMMNTIKDPIGSSAFNAFFGGSGNALGNFMNQIPQNALSFFGLGSILG